MRERACRLLLSVSIAAALGAILLSVTAGLIGIDADQKWGPFRIGLLVMGAGWLVAVALLRLVDALDRRLVGVGPSDHHPFSPSEEPSGPSRDPLGIATAAPSAIPIPRIAASESGCQPSPRRLSLAKRGRRIGLVLFMLAAGLLYLWLASASLMTELPPTTDFYSLLADSFSQGRTDLLIDPPQELASLDDPYDPGQRKGLSILMDASYYHGRYFLYWGPAPTVFSVVWKTFFPYATGDQYVGLLAGILFLAFSCLIILELKRRYFPTLPGWTLVAALVVVATAHPILWNMSWPGVWEAAVTGGQAFLLAGLFFALPAIAGSDVPLLRLVLAGVFLGLAVASRFTLAPAAATLMLAGAMGLLRSSNVKLRKNPAIPSLAAFIAPLAVVIGLLGLYNYVRFGNALQTGFQYQLTTDQDYGQLADQGVIFNISYLAPNLIYYGFAPPRASEEFPFLKPVRGELPSVNMFLRGLHFSTVHKVENVTGIVFAVPLALFSGLLCWTLLCGDIGEDPAEPRSSGARNLGRREGLARIAGSLLIAGGATFLTIAAYRYVASRFGLDYSPMLVIASVVGAWHLQSSNRGRPIRRRLVNGLFLLAVGCTVIVSMLLAVSGPASRLDDYNPALWRLLTQVRLW